MVQPKYNPQEALERVKLMMKYDSSKTLNENKQIIFEQSSSDVFKQASTAAALGAGVAAAGSFGLGAPVGAVVGFTYGLLRALSSGNVSRGKIKELFSSCSTNKKDLGDKTLSDEELDTIGDNINTAIRGVGTDEDSIKLELQKIPTVPDLCALVNNYNQFHGNFSEDLDDDLEGDDEWRDYVLLPLRKAIRNSLQKPQKSETGGSNTVSGWEKFPCVPHLANNHKIKMNSNGSFSIGDFLYFANGRKGNIKTKQMSNYTCNDPEFRGLSYDPTHEAGPARIKKSSFKPCSGIYEEGCSGEAIKKVQACIKTTPPLKVDGLYGRRTKIALKGLGFNSFRDEDVDKICSINKTVETPGETSIEDVNNS